MFEPVHSLAHSATRAPAPSDQVGDGKPVGIRDAEARRAIQMACPLVVASGLEWYEMEATAPVNLDAVTDALLWLEERGGETHGFTAERHPHYPSLIRFLGAP